MAAVLVACTSFDDADPPSAGAGGDGGSGAMSVAGGGGWTAGGGGSSSAGSSGAGTGAGGPGGSSTGGSAIGGSSGSAAGGSGAGGTGGSSGSAAGGSGAGGSAGSAGSGASGSGGSSTSCPAVNCTSPGGSPLTPRCGDGRQLPRDEAQFVDIDETCTTSDYHTTSCGYAGNERSYRIFMLQGETITVRAVAFLDNCSSGSNGYPLGVRLSQGGCTASATCGDIVACHAANPEKTFMYTATRDGFVYIVLDREDAGGGSFRLEVDLDCANPNCDCPQ